MPHGQEWVLEVASLAETVRKPEGITPHIRLFKVVCVPLRSALNCYLTPYRFPVIIVPRLNVRRMLHVKCGCNGENCKINIARAIFSFVHEVNPMLVRGAKGFV